MLELRVEAREKDRDSRRDGEENEKGREKESALLTAETYLVRIESLFVEEVDEDLILGWNMDLELKRREEREQGRKVSLVGR